MKYYTISQETVDEIKRRLKIRTQMIKFYQNMVREKRDSEPLEEIGVGGFEPVEEGVVIDARDKSSMIPDMMITEEITPSNDKALSIFENFEKFAKQNVEMRSNNKDQVIKDLQNEVYNQHQTIETLRRELEMRKSEDIGVSPDIIDFASLREYKDMSHDELVNEVKHLVVKLKQLQADNRLKSEMVNKQGDSHFWEERYKEAKAELDNTNRPSLSREIDILKDKLYDLEQLNMKLSTELEAEKAKTNSMMALSNKVQSTAENYDSASKKTIEELKDKIEKQAKTIDGLKHLNLCSSKELEYYKEKLMHAENDIETLNTTIDKLSFTLNSRKSPSDYDELKDKIGKQADTIENLAVSNQCLSNKNRKLSDTIDKLNSDIDILQKTVDKLNGMIGPRDSEDLKDRIFVVQSYANNNSIRYYISIDKKEIQSSVRLAKEMNIPKI